MIALSQKGILAFKLSSYKVQSVWQQLKSTYLSQDSMCLLCIYTRFHNRLQQSKQRKSYLTCLRHCKTVQIPIKNMKNKLTTKFPVSFQIQFKTVSTTYTVQVVSNDSLHVPIKRTHNCSSNYILGYLMHLTNQTNFPKQANTAHSVVNSQSQHQVPLCLQCHDGSYLSLSQHSSTYTARQTTMLQASISRSPVSANIRQAPLLLHTTEPQVFNYSRITLQMWQLNQGHWQSKLDPPWFSCQRFPIYGN